MPHLLARLGPRTAPDRRWIHARGRDREETVAEPVAGMAEGRLVLLEGAGPPWSRAVPVRPAPWPAGLRDLSPPGPATRQHLDELWGARGLWTLDPRGEPCELVWGRERETMAVLLNYSGWRFADLPAGPFAVSVARCALGPVLVLDPEHAPLPRHESGSTEPRERELLRTSKIGA